MPVAVAAKLNKIIAIFCGVLTLVDPSIELSGISFTKLGSRVVLASPMYVLRIEQFKVAVWLTEQGGWAPNGLYPPSSYCNSVVSVGVQPDKFWNLVWSNLAPLKVRKEKLGCRITTLHQLVSPFGKTDTASVLLEAIGYIRFALVAWFALLNRLPTRDRLSNWGLDVVSSCVLCSNDMETRDHLFFGCEFSKEVWVGVLQMCHISWSVGSWSQEVAWAVAELKGRSSFSALLKLA
ncbi:hypothetical protein F3Y22_tig00109987pilonHSYRG00041 [Hibiscus syriacus]|uniref:BHLH domain-containing protein n=1 Tax=Hibiscus syriacus TaxID=106335 RepID=A0A6A3BQC3_HIBSY|nr:hypothetical protein F3Y22_tig00109987pilonHSYRG00041 [Hibiscus syriacus]